MIDHPCEDDYALQIYAFADGHDPGQFYVIDNVDDLETEIDFMILYSPEPLNHVAYLKSSKSRPDPYTQIEVNLIAYHGDESLFRLSLDSKIDPYRRI